MGSLPGTTKLIIGSGSNRYSGHINQNSSNPEIPKQEISLGVKGHLFVSIIVFEIGSQVAQAGLDS